MPDPRGPSIDKHPQRQEIHDAIMAGESLRKLATRLNPPVHHSTLSRYKSDYIAPAIRALRSNSPKTQAIKKLAVQNGVTLGAQAERAIRNVPPATTSDVTGLAHELQTRVRKTLSDIDRYKANAEDEEVYDSEGNPVGKRMNHNALGLHVRNELSAVKNIGELAGIYASANVSQVLQVVVSMPAPVQIESDNAMTLDVLPER